MGCVTSASGFHAPPGPVPIVHLVRQCTLLAIGISQAQAWLDGNKRTAYACATVFLILNGHEYTGDPLELAR